jgi:hypothetical protein
MNQSAREIQEIGSMFRLNFTRPAAQSELKIYSRHLVESASSSCTLEQIKFDLDKGLLPITHGDSLAEFVSENLYFFCRALSKERFQDFATTHSDNLDAWPDDYHLVQFWDSDDVPDDVSTLIKSWVGVVPEGVHMLFNCNSASKFIQKFFPHYVLKAFEVSKHPAMKSDLFRLAYLYQCGGAYVDADDRATRGLPIVDYRDNAVLVVSPIIRQSNQDSKREVHVKDFVDGPLATTGPEAYFANSPILAGRRNNAIRIALLRAVESVLDAYHESISFDIHMMTGPTQLSRSICETFLLDSLIGTRSMRLSVMQWSDFAHRQLPLAYKQTERDWRIFESMEKSKLLGGTLAR